MMISAPNASGVKASAFIAVAVWFIASATAGTSSANDETSARWPMKHRDMYHTGRADYDVPAERTNDSFFDIFSWQQDAPGPLSSTSMTFFDTAGPGGSDIVVGGYHWPKGVQGMDRHTGALFWSGNPRGGETIGTMTAAFSFDGSVLYVVNDATESESYPDGHPLMAFWTSSGPATYWHNGDDPEPQDLSLDSPTLSPDGRVFMHRWVDRPYAATDNGTSLSRSWVAESYVDCGHSDPSLYEEAGELLVVIGGRGGHVYCFEGTFGYEVWSSYVGAAIDATATVDPANGNIYIPAGDNDTYVIGLDIYGEPLWSSAAIRVYDHQPGQNAPHRSQAAGCLSHAGDVYYFQTNSDAGDGMLYAINTADGSLRWTYPTNSRGWESISSSPIVTTDGVVIVGNNEGDTYYALLDAGDHAELLDTLAVDAEGNARASATLSSDGKLYLPLRTQWTVGNGDGDIPDQQVRNLFTCLDLTAEPAVTLPIPAGQAAFALNNAVRLKWLPISDPSGHFAHYAIYRDEAPFDSVDGMTPIATVTPISAGSHIDDTAINGTSYYYAVTSVADTGGEIKGVGSIGPRTPFDESDLQVVCVARTPRYPRYDPLYTWYEVTEPSGFGPYGFTSATGLGSGQTGDTQRWPMPGDTVTYTATVRNRGTNPWGPTIRATWRVDGLVVAQPVAGTTLEPGQTTTFSFELGWSAQASDIEFTIDESDDRPDNNASTINTKSVAFLTYIDATFYEAYREATVDYPAAQTDDLIDWLNRHMDRFNEMFADAGCAKRVHYDILNIIDDLAPDPGAERIDFAIFPFRYHRTDGDPRGSGYYDHGEDIDYGLLHEMGHQLGLIDLYRMNMGPDQNQLSGIGYSAPAGLMNGCSHFLSAHSANAMNHWLDKAHGYYGQYLYNMPAEVRLRVLGMEGEPLTGATVKVYQKAERPNQGEVITTQIKGQGTTDANGEYVLDNIPIDPAKVPPTHIGDELHANPFGYVAVVGTNGVLHFRIEYQGGIDYVWLDITEVNNAFWDGQTDVAVFERQVSLGGPVQYVPPDEISELNADDWSAWAQGSTSLDTYVLDDTDRTVVGAGAVKFVTDGPFDTYVRYPRTYTADWNLSCADLLRIRFYAENPNPGFQTGSPWIRLKDAENNYFEYQYFINNWPHDLLNEARDTWKAYEIPLGAPPDTQTGWRRTTVGTPSLSHIQYIEIHADTWGDSFTLWLDGVGFDTRCRSLADLDGDNDVDQDDFDGFEACATGPELGPPARGCEVVDFEPDADVDQSDFGVFQRCYSGAGAPADPYCSD